MGKETFYKKGYEVSVDNFPSEYPLPATQVSDLKNIRQLSPSDVVTIANQIATDTDGHGQVDVITLPPLPAGNNTIGNVNAIKSGTWNIDNLLNPHPVQVNREGKVSHFSVAATAAGATTIYTPSTGKAAQVLGWSFYCDADVVCLLRFTTSGNVIAGLPAKGAHAMNLLGLTPPQGAADETVEIYVSGAANVRGFIIVKEV